MREATGSGLISGVSSAIAWSVLEDWPMVA